MIIKVTRQDIRKGSRFVNTRCPIARAVNRVANARKVSLVRVECEFIYIKLSNGDTCCAQLSKKAIRFIDDFDDRKPVRPFTTRVNFGVNLL